jgi:hypothetical protein
MRTAASATERLFNLVADVLSTYDFSTAARILDFGGGAGPRLIEMSYAHPALTGCVLDLPRWEVAPWHALLEANLTDGAAFISRDVFEDTPGGFDTMHFKNVLHNWDDAYGAVLFAHCGRALG